MFLVDRLKGTPRPPYRGQDFANPGLVGTELEDVLIPMDGDSRFVFYNIGLLGQARVIVFGRTQEEAVEVELPRRLGLS